MIGEKKMIVYVREIGEKKLVVYDIKEVYPLGLYIMWVDQVDGDPCFVVRKGTRCEEIEKNLYIGF